MADQSQTQQVLQNLTGVQTQAQPNATVNNGNPNTVYNVSPQNVSIPPQANATGQWWMPSAQPMNPLIANIIAQTYGRYPPGSAVPLPPPPPSGGGTTTPPPVVPRPRNRWEPGDGPYGGEGHYCVAAGMVLEGSVKAEKAVMGLVATTHTPEEGFALHAIEAVGELVKQPCVLLVTEKNAMLVCSVSTPFTMVGASSDGETIPAPAMLGELVYVKRGKKTVVEKVTHVLDAGEQMVVPISFGGRSFPAGVDKDALIYSHNIGKIPGSGANLIAFADSLSRQFGQSWGDTSYITTAGQLQQMDPAAAAMYAGGNAYLPGGNLYTGGSVPLPATTTPPPATGTTAPATQAPAPSTTQQPASTSTGNWFTRLMASLGVTNIVPRDRDGTVDWQGLILETLGGPAAGLIDTRGAEPAPVVSNPNTNYGPQP